MATVFSVESFIGAAGTKLSGVHPAENLTDAANATFRPAPAEHGALFRDKRSTERIANHDASAFQARDAPRAGGRHSGATHSPPLGRLIIKGG